MAVLGALLGCSGGGAPAEDDTGSADALPAVLVPVAGAVQPTAVAVHPETGDLYVAERRGQVLLFRRDAADAGDAVGRYAPEAEVLLDLRDAVEDESGGLVGLELTPDADQLVLGYTDADDADITFERVALADDGTVDEATRTTILKVERLEIDYAALGFPDEVPPNHVGGDAAFGPDGHLFLSVGDGGPPVAQDLGLLFGKLLRVDLPEGSEPGYTVPEDNPFVDDPEARPEIWAYGLRNPFRFSFDRDTGDLWVSDVGDQNLEEVDRLSVADGLGRGANLGHPFFEGTLEALDGAPEDLVGPTYEYERDGGRCGITGGVVYRGAQLPSLEGRYLFADLCRPEVFALDPPDAGVEPAEATEDVVAMVDTGSQTFVSFAEDADGEVFVVALEAGLVYRLVAPGDAGDGEGEGEGEPA